MHIWVIAADCCYLQPWVYEIIQGESAAARKRAPWGIPMFQGPGEGEKARVSKRRSRESRRKGGTEPQESGLRREGLVSWLRTAE